MQELSGHVARAAVLFDDWTERRWAGDATSSGTSSVTFQARVRPSAVAEFCRSVPARLESGDWSADAGTGIIRVRATDGFTSAYLHELRQHAVLAGGSLTLLRCPGPWRNPELVWGPPRGDWPLMRKVKQALDAGVVFNPGRFLAGI
jgi:hypothetical protein